MDVAWPETNSLRAQGEKHEKGRRLKRDRNNMDEIQRTRSATYMLRLDSDFLSQAKLKQNSSNSINFLLQVHATRAIMKPGCSWSDVCEHGEL